MRLSRIFLPASLTLLAACSGDGTSTQPTPVPSLTWVASPDTLDEGQSITLQTLGGAGTRYSVSDATVATIDSITGALSARAPGQVTVGARAGGARITRVLTVIPSPVARLEVAFAQPAAGVFTVDDTARTLRVTVRRRNGRDVTDSLPVTIALVTSFAPHAEGVLRLAATGAQASIGPARRGYWRGFAVVTAGGRRDSVPLRSTGFLARFIFEPTTAVFPASPAMRAVADSTWRVWARYIVDTLPRQDVFTFPVRARIPVNLHPTAPQVMASTDRVVIVSAMSQSSQGFLGSAQGARRGPGESPLTVAGSLFVNTSLSVNPALLAETMVHELGHVLGVGDHEVWTAAVSVIDRPNGTRGATLVFPATLGALRAAGGGLPGWVGGLPLTADRAHWAAAAAGNDIMQSGDGSQVTTASLLALRECGYRIDLDGAPAGLARNVAGEGWFVP